ncbi:MAG: diguanylate cyclase, partial [Gammaproteobacteria bacterium]|nr:diguanylate cyclase [Gammaproteobacteria bacterium]
MNLKSRTILLLTPVIMIPVLLLAAVSYSKLRESAEAHLDTHVTTLLDQIARQSFDAEFFDKTQLLTPTGGKADTGTDDVISREMALHLFSLENTVKTSTIGKSGYLMVIDALGDVLFLPDNIQPVSAEASLRLLGEKIAMEDSKIRAEINVDGKVLIAYWKELASGMNVVAFVPEAELSRHGSVHGMFILIMAVTLTLFMVVVVLTVLRYLYIKPVKALNTAAGNISRGHFNVDVNVDRDDEIGQLSKAFVTVSKNLKQTREDAGYIARHDGLTGLPNKVMFDEYLEHIIAMARTKQHRVALLFITVGNLRQVNESHGQPGGDALVRETATRLNSSLRKNSGDDLHDKSLDMVCRYGGNEFIILLDDIDGAWDATVVSDRILNLLQHPVQFGNTVIDISCSIGITIFPDDSVSAQELIKNADIAMYRARDQGKNQYTFYSEPTNELMHRHMRIHSRLRSGFEADQFFMDYQPKVRAVSREIVGIEALIRWQDPEDGLISPDDFLPIASDSGLLPEITRWTIEHVCKQAMVWFS